MEKNEIFRYVDHTLLKTTASTAQLKELCDDAIAYGTASVCIPPDRVRQVRQYVGSRMYRNRFPERLQYDIGQGTGDVGMHFRRRR